LNSQEELGGFCFNCAAKAPQFAPSPPQTQQKQSTHLQNPWPILVQSDDPYSVWSQPLTRIMYAPSTIEDVWTTSSRQRPANRVKPNPDDLAAFYDHFIFLHECGHLVAFDWTPVKEIARLILAFCYDSIDQLMQFCSSPMSAEDAWEIFADFTWRLGTVEKSIKFPEELIATAFALRAMEEQTLPGGMWTGFQEELEILKESALAHEGKNFLEFRVAYERTEPLVQLLFGWPRLASYVIPLLQPVVWAEGERMELRVQIYEASGYLDIISSIRNSLAGHLENEEAAVRRLQLLNEESERLKQEREGWRVVLGNLIKWVGEPVTEVGGIEHRYGTFVQLLWNISKGNIEKLYTDSLDTNFLTHADQIIGKLQDGIMKGSPLGLGNVFLLQRWMYKTQSIIRVVHSGFSEGSVSEDVKANHRALLFYEGIRQQLVVRKGFICPFSFGRQSCCCDSQTRKGLRRLAHLASDGLFGPGEWSLPLCLALRRR